MPYLLSIEDAQLERDIRDMRMMLIRACRDDVKRVYAEAMASLIALRSAEQIKIMEEKQGIR